MSDSTHTLGKILVLLFAIEVIGILLSFVGASANSPSIAQFSNLTTNVNTTTTNLRNAFTINLLQPINTTSSNCMVLWVFSCENNAVANAIMSIGNAGIYVVNIIYKFFNLLWNLLALVGWLIVIMLDMFIVVIPSLLVATGIIGYILSIGYAFIVLFLGYKAAYIVLEIVGKIFGMTMAIK